MMENPTNQPAPPRRHVDGVTALMVALTLLSLAGAFWIRFGPDWARRGADGSAADDSGPITVGAPAPRLHLLDPSTSEPMVLAGLKGRVVWLVFWSSRTVTGSACLAEMAAAAQALRAHPGFALATAAVEPDGAAALRAARTALGDKAEANTSVPVYLATPGTQRRFRAGTADPPLHVLIDAQGTVIAIVRHAGRATIDRIAKRARYELERMRPDAGARFAVRLVQAVPAMAR